MLKKLRIAWDYFLYHPDKTQVIVLVYFLNPIFKFIERVTFFIIDKIRKVILWLRQDT